MKSTKVKTKNILNSLKKYSEANLISLDEIDFKILSVESLIKTIHEKDFSHFNEKLQEHYTTDEKTINEHVEFKQLYIIEIFREINFKVLLNYKLKYNEYQSEADIIISPDSIIPYEDNKIKSLYSLLTSELNKIKAKEGMLVNLYDEAYIQKLKAFTKHIYAGKFKKTLKLPLIKCINPSITRKSELIIYYEDKKNEYGISEVDSGETIMEYIKPKFGLNGLNVFGEIIDAAAFNNSKDLDKEVDQKSIKIVENDDKRLYIAKVKGYVNATDKRICVDNKIQMQKLSRVQETLSDHEENNIEIILKEHDSTKDGIGEGVELTSETIHVEGFVGSNSFLNATNLIIDGATHQTSRQSAKFARVNRHKGILRCHKADIKLLEGGEVHATDVTIDTCMSGTIYAKNVTIRQVKSNLKVYASDSINIELVSGEENLFRIDPRAIPILEKKLEFIDVEIEDLKFDLEEATRHNKDKIKLIEIELQKLKNMKAAIYDSVLDASIHIEKPLRGFNTITFVLKDNKRLTYTTEAKRYDDFFLEHTNDKVTLKPTSVSVDLS